MCLLTQLRRLLAVFAAKKVLLAHAHLATHHSPSGFSRATPQTGSSQPVSLQGIISSQEQGFAFVLTEFQKALVGPSLQPL